MTNFVDRLRQRLRINHVLPRVVTGKSRHFVFEPLESRILTSADPFLGIGTAVSLSVTEAVAPATVVSATLDVSTPAALVTQRDSQANPASGSDIGARQAQTRHELVFVDSSVEHLDQIVSDLLSQNSGERQIEFRTIDAQKDGIEQISAALAGYKDLDAVHFISHGAAGAVRLGATWLDVNSLQVVEDAIAGWGAALSENADLLFYGCDIAATGSGVAMIDKLSRLTGADVTASINRTGATALGGDWSLEFATGTIEALVAVDTRFQQKWSGLLDSATLQANKDTYIKLKLPDNANNFGASTQLVVDRESTDLQRALLQFDLSSIPANATINSATLQMQSTQIGGTLNISVYELLQAWAEGAANGTADVANWNQSVTGTNWTTAGGTFNSTAVANLNTNSTGLHTWDITALVQAWVDGSKVNNGLMVASPDGGGNRTVTYDSSEGTIKPVLVIDYTVSNAAPTASNLDTAETYALNTPLNLANIVISDVDSPNVTATLTISDSAAGSLNTGTSGSVTSTYNAVTGVWTASGAIGDVNMLLANLTYTPSLLYLSPFTIATSVDDGVAPPITGSKNMTATLINLPPLATNLNAAETYTEDTPLNFADIVITDIDSPNVTARLTLSDSAAGSLNTGTSGSVTSTYNAVTGVWSASGAIGDVNTLLANLVFTPTANYNSNFTIATSVDDGVAAPITGVKTMTATAVNDAPAATNLNAAETYTEDTPVNLTNIVISDVDSTNVTATFTLSDSAAGSLNTGTSGSVTSTYNAVTGVWSASGAKADVNTLLAGVTFSPSSNYNSNFTIATSVNDGIAPAITGVKNMTATTVNDAPTATNLNTAETYTEDIPLSLSNIIISDVDSAIVTATLTLSDVSAGSLSTATSGSVTSTYNAVTGAWTASGAIADVNVLLANLAFTPAANYNSNFTIATNVDDGVAPVITGTKSMTGIAVNDAPIATNLNATESYTENTPLNLTDIVISDVDSANVTATLTLSDSTAGSLSTATSGSVTSTYNAVTGVWSASGAISDVNDLLSGVTFNPSTNYNSNFTIATSVDDGVASAITGTKNMTGVAVNDAPTATNLNAAETYTEDTPVNLTNIVVSDVDSANVTATLTLSDLAAGSLSTATSGSVTSTYNAGTGIWLASGALTDVNALLAGLTFSPALNYNSNFSIATSVDDGIASAITGTKNITGVAVNDAPTATNLNTAETYTEDTPLNLSNIIISDVDSTNLTATLTLSDVSAGSLSTATSGSVTSTYTAVTGVWTASGAIADVNVLLANLAFTPAANYNSSFTIATSVDDGIAPGITGVKNTTGIAVNDSPTATNLNAAETYTEDMPLSLTDIVMSDLDSPNVTATLILSDISAGSLNTATSGSVTSTYNAATGVWRASGAIADVNTILAGLTFTPALNYNSDFTIATSVDDGVAPAITGTKNMTGSSDNDAPVLVGNTLTISEGGSVVLTSSEVSATDVDDASGSLSFTVSSVSGGQFELVASPGVAITGFTQAQVTGGAVRFVHDGGEAAPSYDVTVSDGALIDGPAAAAISFTNVNDAPVLGNNGLIITQGASVVLTSANLSATDADNNNLVFSISGISGGQFELVASPGFAVTSFTQVQVVSGAVRFVHDGGTAAPSYAVTVSDGGLSDGPAAATITFFNLVDTDEVLPPPPLVPEPPVPLQVLEPILGDGGPVPADNSNPTGNPVTTGNSGTDSSPSSTLALDNFNGEFPAPNNNGDSQETDYTSRPSSSRIPDKSSSEIREGISARSEAPSITQDSQTEETTTNVLTSGDLSSVFDVPSFVQELNKLRDEVAEQTNLEKIVVGTTLTGITGFSIGYVLWLVRGEILLTSLLASLPAWRLIDPLPVLSFLNKSADEHEDEDDDSIEAAVERGAKIPQPVSIPRQQSGARSVKWRVVVQPTDTILEKS